MYTYVGVDDFDDEEDRDDEEARKRIGQLSTWK